MIVKNLLMQKRFLEFVILVNEIKMIMPYVRVSLTRRWPLLDFQIHHL